MQIEIEIQKNDHRYYARHSCKTKDQPLVLMQKSIDPRFFIGTCPNCKDQVYARRIENGKTSN